MRIAVLNEVKGEETRVALVPESVKKLIGMKASIAVQSGAGIEAGASDDDYKSAGAEVFADAAGALASADVVASVNLPAPEVIGRIRKGAVVIGFMKPLDDPSSLVPLIEQGLTGFSVELIPRTTRAQSMDALSTMATIVGYKAVLLAAVKLPRMFPMLTTAAGTVPPAKALVLGAGVAGLQAIATARRLGAVVEGFDIRAAAGEAVRSLGAKFLEVDLAGIQTEDAGGYAKEVTEEAMERSRAMIAKAAHQTDMIITSAQVPGKRAPLLVTEEAVRGMKHGSVIVDLAGANGGNCALTAPGETIDVNGVTIASPLNLAATVPVHASQLYSRNLTAFFELIIKEGALSVDLSNEILGQSCVASDGKAVNARVAAALGAEVA